MTLLQLAGYLWEAGAAVFLTFSGYGIHRARKRGQRLFRDEPLKRIEQLQRSTVDHTQDAP